MKIKYLLLSVAVTVTSTAFAEQSSSDATFKKLDRNSDGYISIKEAAENAALVKSWKTLDTDTNEKLEMSEFSAFEEEQDFTPPQNSDTPDIGAAPHK